MHMPSTTWQHHEDILAGLSHPQYPSSQYAVPGTTQAPIHPSIHPNPDPFQAGLAVNTGGPMPQSLQANHYGPIGGRDTPGMEMSMDESQQLDEDNGGPPAKRRKGVSNNQNNDLELRRLLMENEGRELSDVAQQCLKDEAGTKSEKLKQIFGMLWYVCMIPNDVLRF